jgi:hypothetical protein
MRKTKTVEERFFEKVVKTDGCWVWLGSKGRRGYGALHVIVNGVRQMMGAHRISWTIHNGPIPAGLFVCHKCDNPQCTNPDHLFLGDGRDNMRDCAAKGRVTNIGMSRLTHCRHGHKFTPENTRITTLGHRRCIACEKDTNHRHKEKRMLWARKYRADKRALAQNEKPASVG